jgi:hypothetical protein
LARGTMLQPALSGLEVIVGADGEPHVANVAMDALGIEFANVGIVGEELVSRIDRIYVLFVADGRT